MSETYDLIIVGGGIAGSALGAVMARDGKSVLILEAQEDYADRVRGEWIAPWGVTEVKRVGLYDTLMEAGGHHLSRHLTFDESRPPEVSESRPLPLSIFAPGVPGPLCIGHPHHCRTLFAAAKAAGATALKPVDVTSIVTGAAPEVTYAFEGETRTARAPLIVGADGRLSKVREAAGIELHQDKPHHWFAGLLIEGATDWPEDLQAIGTEGDFGFLAFPQGGGKVRIYGGYALDQRSRFAGPEGPAKFLEAFRMESAPGNEALAKAKPAGPLFSYFNNDSWTDQPYGEGVVLIGDAAGWNDPIIGLGLSITYRDVRIVSELLKAGSTDFSSYAEERTERMRRLRWAAKLQSLIDMEFTPEARERRARYHQSQETRPELHTHGIAVMAGPELAPPHTFSQEHFDAVAAI